MKSLNEIVAELRMGDDGGKPAYRIGRADKVEVSMPSGTPVRSYVIECVTIKELADWIEAAVARERGPGNAAAMREALVELTDKVLDYLHKGLIQLPLPIEDATAKARAALTVPPRNCDVGTEKEQQDRFREFCRHYESEGECGLGRSEAACPAFQGGRNPDCSLWWALMPCAEEEGAEDGNSK